MVRFHWHVEDGFGAHIPPSAMSHHNNTGVQHVSCQVEIAGEATPMEALFTVPAGYIYDGKVRDIGIVLGHNKPEEWKGTLLTEVAVALAEAGYVVVRYHSTARELRRQRMYEKALDVCATSPFARFVQRWVLAGVGHGARLAAIVGLRARGHVCGYVFISYPLTDCLQTAKGPVLPDSSILLLRVPAPALFIHGAKDTKAPVSQIRTVAAQMKAAADVRLVEVPDANSSFETGEPPALQPATMEAITKPLLEFVSALQRGQLEQCKVAHANPPGQPAVVLSESAAAGIAAQIAILDEDDSLVYETEPFGNVAADTAAAGAINGQQQQQHLLQQQLQLQALQQQQAQQQLAAVVAAKTGMTLQQAAAAQRATAGSGFGIQLSKLPAGVTAAQVAAAGSGAAAAAAAGAAGAPSSAALVAPVMLSGLPAGLLTGGLTPQMLAAAQAQMLAAKQGIRPGAGAQIVLPAGATLAGVQQQQQQQQAGSK